MTDPGDLITPNVASSTSREKLFAEPTARRNSNALDLAMPSDEQRKRMRENMIGKTLSTAEAELMAKRFASNAVDMPTSFVKAAAAGQATSQSLQEVRRASQHRKSLVEEVRGIYDMEEIKGKLSEQEWEKSKHFYTDSAMLKRDSIRFNPKVKAALDALYECIDSDGDGMIALDEYKVISRKLYLCLRRYWDPELPLLTDEQYERMALTDWAADAKGLEHMDRDMFCISMFQLCDMWTDTIRDDHYQFFLEKVLGKLTLVDLAGRRTFRADSEFQLDSDDLAADLAAHGGSTGGSSMGDSMTLHAVAATAHGRKVRGTQAQRRNMGDTGFRLSQRRHSAIKTAAAARAAAVGAARGAAIAAAVVVAQAEAMAAAAVARQETLRYDAEQAAAEAMARPGLEQQQVRLKRWDAHRDDDYDQHDRQSEYLKEEVELCEMQRYLLQASEHEGLLGQLLGQKLVQMELHRRTLALELGREELEGVVHRYELERSSVGKGPQAQQQGAQAQLEMQSQWGGGEGGGEGAFLLGTGGSLMGGSLMGGSLGGGFAPLGAVPSGVGEASSAIGLSGTGTAILCDTYQPATSAPALAQGRTHSGGLSSMAEHPGAHLELEAPASALTSGLEQERGLTRSFALPPMSVVEVARAEPRTFQELREAAVVHCRMSSLRAASAAGALRSLSHRSPVSLRDAAAREGIDSRHLPMGALPPRLLHAPKVDSQSIEDDANPVPVHETGSYPYAMAPVGQATDLLDGQRKHLALSYARHRCKHQRAKLPGIHQWDRQQQQQQYQQQQYQQQQYQQQQYQQQQWQQDMSMWEQGTCIGIGGVEGLGGEAGSLWQREREQEIEELRKQQQQQQQLSASASPLTSWADGPGQAQPTSDGEGEGEKEGVKEEAGPASPTKAALLRQTPLSPPVPSRSSLHYAPPAPPSSREGRMQHEKRERSAQQQHQQKQHKQQQSGHAIAQPAPQLGYASNYKSFQHRNITLTRPQSVGGGGGGYAPALHHGLSAGVSYASYASNGSIVSNGNFSGSFSGSFGSFTTPSPSPSAAPPPRPAPSHGPGGNSNNRGRRTLTAAATPAPVTSATAPTTAPAPATATAPATAPASSNTERNTSSSSSSNNNSAEGGGNEFERTHAHLAQRDAHMHMLARDQQQHAHSCLDHAPSSAHGAAAHGAELALLHQALCVGRGGGLGLGPRTEKFSSMSFEDEGALLASRPLQSAGTGVSAQSKHTARSSSNSHSRNNNRSKGGGAKGKGRVRRRAPTHAGSIPMQGMVKLARRHPRLGYLLPPPPGSATATAPASQSLAGPESDAQADALAGVGAASALEYSRCGGGSPAKQQQRQRLRMGHGDGTRMRGFKLTAGAASAGTGASSRMSVSAR